MIIETLAAVTLLGTAGAFSVYQCSEPAQLRKAARQLLGTVRASLRRVRGRVESADRKLQKAARRYERDKQKERLRDTSIRELRNVGVSNVRWTALEDAGIRSVADLQRRSPRALQSIDGVGSRTAEAVTQGNRRLVQDLQEQPVDLPAPEEAARRPTRKLARAAWRALAARDQIQPTVTRLDQELGALESTWAPVKGETRFRDWALRRIDEPTLDRARGEVGTLRGRVQELAGEGVLDAHRKPLRPPSRAALAADFLERYADYSAVIERALEPASPTTPDGAGPTPDAAQEAVALHGPHRGLTEEVARRIEAYPLDVRGLSLTLRGYQQFGAKYLLAQEQTLLGDEMGLGKTIQALAAMVHLQNAGLSRHFLVVCPASILGNWTRELAKRTRLRTWLLSGPGRGSRVQEWIAGGGVGLTSYATLRNLGLANELRDAGVRVGLLVADEAHYAKNPEAARSRAVQEVRASSDRICLMSGTPLENRLGEFRELVSLACPKVASDLPEEEVSFAGLASLVAPVYLRRNQPDVLRELPERIETDEWLDLSPSDLGAYRDAVLERNYMAMRRATTVGDGRTASAKLSRLGELLEEYRASERKVVIFSFFLEVLEVLRQQLSPVGTLEGAVPPAQRLELIDRFQSTEGFAVLLSQIEAGGVGINLQGASVVVLMEPQWKPSTESQAIARAHRMGQTRNVIVHRMLARDSVDERMVERLRAKQELFDRYVRDSELKEASSEATERGFSEAVISEELARFSESSSEADSETGSEAGSETGTGSGAS